MSKTAITGTLLTLPIDKARPVPLWQQLTDALRDAIRQGRMAPGTKLPSTRTFADEFGISRNTVLQVFDTLIAEGYLVSRVGAGTFVADVLPESLTSISQTPSAEAASPCYPFRSLSRRGKHLVISATGEFAERPTPFTPDLPDLREFPIRTWLRLLSETSGRLTGEILADASNAGYEPLRRAIAQHVGSARGVRCDFSQIIITTGSQQSLDLVCRLLLDPGDPVWLEEPGYVGARAVITANGGVINPVPVDREGMCIDTGRAAHTVPRLIFTSPSRHYPLGATMSLARRRALIDFARSGGSWIVEDDYDSEFRYSGSPLPAIQGLDPRGRTVYIGTFSKVLLPSFRLGYIIVPRDLAGAFATARAVVDRHASLIEQMVLSEFMHRGLFSAHIRRIRTLYQARQAKLLRALQDVLQKDMQIAATETGTHIVIPMVDDADDRRISIDLAKGYGVVVRPLSPYYAGRSRQRGLLLGFAAFDDAEIEAGMARMKVAGVLSKALGR